jgi:hypothetical protein
MTQQRTYSDPVIELAIRCGGPERVLDFADTTADEAETMLEVLDEVEAEERAASIAGNLRRMGHTL